MSRRRLPNEGSFQHLDGLVIAYLQGREEVEPSVRAILGSHRPGQIKAVFLGEGERYRRFNRARFIHLVDQLRLRGILW